MTKNGTSKGPVCFLFAEYVVWDFVGLVADFERKEHVAKNTRVYVQ